MNKTELINEVAEKACITKKATEMVINALVGSITEALAAGDKVSIIGFGTFEVKERKAREGMNPRTGEKITIEGYKAPVFKAGKQLKTMVKLK